MRTNRKTDPFTHTPIERISFYLNDKDAGTFAFVMYSVAILISLVVTPIVIGVFWS